MSLSEISTSEDTLNNKQKSHVHPHHKEIGLPKIGICLSEKDNARKNFALLLEKTFSSFEEFEEAIKGLNLYKQLEVYGIHLSKRIFFFKAKHPIEVRDLELIKPFYTRAFEWTYKGTVDTYLKKLAGVDEKECQFGPREKLASLKPKKALESAEKKRMLELINSQYETIDKHFRPLKTFIDDQEVVSRKVIDNMDYMNGLLVELGNRQAKSSVAIAESIDTLNKSLTEDVEKVGGHLQLLSDRVGKAEEENGVTLTSLGMKLGELRDGSGVLDRLTLLEKTCSDRISALEGKLDSLVEQTQSILSWLRDNQNCPKTACGANNGVKEKRNGNKRSSQ